uniref:Preprotein translocase subunit SecE n=1 Tax=Cryptomonas curvata TaxID=233186 RepID=A0A7S0M6E4_9CRYP|nr:preprotein translocase secE subunit [Cryptomonas curvata]|mmetsp:Transcript_26663/g.55338  ORF Transcript_26663/g.55338 Transcript_26663/m.55338 type:complete len:137 (+) Transcript_26663:34-444(+)
MIYKSLCFAVISDFNIFSKKIEIKKNKSFICNYNLHIKTKKILKEKADDNQENFKVNKEHDVEVINNDFKLDSETNWFSFWKEISEEIKMVEWPSVDRLFKQFVIVLISLVVSAFIIYSVDGLFAWGSKILFEGKN